MSRVRGYGMIEMVSAMVMFGLILTALVMIFNYSIDLNATGSQLGDTEREALMAHTRLARELSQTSITQVLNTTFLSAGGKVPPAGTDATVRGIAFFLSGVPGSSYSFAVSNHLPAPNNPGVPTDPLTGASISQTAPAWNRLILYFAQVTSGTYADVWRTEWPACSCGGLSPCGGALVNRVTCSDFTRTTDSVTGLTSNRLNTDAMSKYAISTGLPVGVTTERLAQRVNVSFQINSQDNSSVTSAPEVGPLRVMLVVTRNYAQYPASPPPNSLPAGYSWGGSLSPGDSYMVLDSTVQPAVWQFL